MGRARKRGRGTKAGVGVKKGKKIRPVKLKRRQGRANVCARRSVTLADYLAAFAGFGCAGLNYQVTNIEVPR